MLSPFQKKSPQSLSVQLSPYTLQASENAFLQLVNHSTALEKGPEAQMLVSSPRGKSTVCSCLFTHILIRYAKDHILCLLEAFLSLLVSAGCADLL